MKEGKNSFRIHLVECSSNFLAYISKHLGHTGPPTNFQNNFIILCGFGVERKVLNPRTVWQVFRNISHTSSIISALKLGMKFSPNKPNFTDEIASRVPL